VSLRERIHFKLISLVHEDLYKLFRDPYKDLRAAGLKSGQRVLEVGCGPGFFTIPAAELVGERGTVCALDLNPLAIEKIRSRIVKEGVDNIETVLADAAQTGLPEESFDLIFVFGFAFAKGDRGEILKELHRLLKPGGILSIGGRGLHSKGNLAQIVEQSRGFDSLKRKGRILQFSKTSCR